MRLDKLAWVLGAAIVATVLGVSPASAQYGQPPPPPAPYYQQPQPNYYPPPPPPGIQRYGLAVGAGFGLGSVVLQPPDSAQGVDSESFGSGSIFLHIGVALNQQSLVLLDLWGSFFQDAAEQNVSHGIYTVNFRYFPVPKLWVQLGLGVSKFTISDRDGYYIGESEEAGVLLGGVGVDLLQGWSYSIDLSLKIALSNYDENPDATTGALQLGFNWY